MTAARLYPCPGCRQLQPYIHVCDYIAMQVPPETTIPEVKQMLAAGKILGRAALGQKIERLGALRAKAEGLTQLMNGLEARGRRIITT